ncbi:hypothetical protein RvY_16252 [Ramazzottius varieornatus]|uniref:chitin synthase n=1 Tax=Ramazzottius varieornatus TaxID=947166 RepID=A0A1D1VYQ4_RAMVA|nr:hypothetical protein RvY_16252 [Ramazzottius varieornatus]
MLTSALCFLPTILAIFSRSRANSYFALQIVLDVVAFACQFSALLFGLLSESGIYSWTLPVSLILISVRWWENYVSTDSPISFVRWLSRHRTNIDQTQTKIYLFVSLWKIIVVLGWIAAWHALSSGYYDVNIFDLKNVFTGTGSVELGGRTVNGTFIERRQRFWFWKPNAAFLLIAVICSAAGFLGNICAKYACRIRIHVFSFSIPFSLVTPATVSVAIAVCEALRADPCAMDDVLPSLVDIKCSQYGYLHMLESQFSWLWFLWLVSHWWTVAHIWWPVPERRKTNHLFALPDFGSFPLDLSSTLNRLRSPAESSRKTLNFSKLIEQNEGPISPRTKAKAKFEKTSHLYTCAFLNGTTDHDVLESLKSILLLDEEQCARRNALKFLIDTDPDYFEMECHLFFEHAFLMDTLRGERMLDRQAAHLIQTFDEAASAVHGLNIELRSPKKITTPYGAQLKWILPGGNSCTAHLKDPNLMRTGDRWSQVMALYYVLGHKIMQLPNELERKEHFAHNSFVLFCSGAVRFKPSAVTRLLDTLKQAKHIGATTCRLRPTGTGPIVWYQMFEYSMRYWLDQATEHMLGSLLRIRAGFTMFRASALMDDNVTKKFAMIPEDAKEFIQFRLGNEQWLCSLMVKKGYKVEYCAAVDVMLHVPETFAAYIKETQRDVPLQLAAMADIVGQYSNVLHRNEHVTIIYIGYLMMALVSSIFACGTVFLVIVTSLVDLFQMNMFLALASNLGPVSIFLTICVFGSPKLQDIVMRIFSAGYGLVMLAVLISATVQLHHSWFSASPVSIFMVAFIFSTVLPAVFHPQEMWNIAFAPIYFIAIPTTYLFTIIHSLCTFHLANGITKPDEDEQMARQIERWEQIAKEAQIDPNSPHAHKVPSIDVIEEMKKFLPHGKKSVSFACGKFCGIICCPPPDISPLEGPFGDLIGRELLQLGKKLQVLEHRLRARRMGLQGFRPRVPPPDGLSMPLNMAPQQDWDQISEASANFSVSTVRTAVKSTEEFYEKFGKNVNNDKLTEWLLSLTDPSGPVVIENDHWMDDEDLIRAEPETLEVIEASFWRELITTYLSPLAGTNAGLEAAMVEQMKKFRNKLSLGFLMINSLFILMVFLLELRRDDLFIWVVSPFGGTAKKPVTVQIEPTGIAFLLFFFLLMLVQFVAMLMHRWGTFSNLLAGTELSCCRNKKRVGFDYLRENAIQVARELQSLKNAKDFDAETSASTMDLGRKAAVSTLDIIFRKRFLAIQRNAEQQPATTVAMPMSIHETLNARKLNVRTLDSRRGISQDPMEKPHAAQVFHIGRNDSFEGRDDSTSYRSTTSF